MEDHRNLKVTGTREALEQIVGGIEKRLDATSGEWRRALDREESIRHLQLRSSNPLYAYECTRKPGRPHASLWLAFDSENQELRVTQIVPAQDEFGSIEVAACNAVVESFHDELLGPAAAEFNVLVEFSGATRSPEDRMNAESAKLLKAFAAGANKNTGSGHPNDRERWHRFLIAAHRDNAEFTADEMAQWLVSDGGFPDEVADKLAFEYAFARRLLIAYDASIGARGK